MLEWWESSYIIILYYRGFTCGKFVSNILSFNKNFMAQISTNNILISNSSVFDKEVEKFLTELKIESIFKTIPPNKEECKNWMRYELGYEIVRNRKRIIGSAGLNLLNNKKYCFVVAHDCKELNAYLESFPNAKVLEIINDDEIYYKSVNLKTPNPNEMNINPVVPYEHSIKFEISSLFDKDKFFQNIDKLLDDFEIVDKKFDDRVYDYYDQYTNLYN